MSNENQKDEFMQAAIDEAHLGRSQGGIPIGSVLIRDGKIVLRMLDPTEPIRKTDDFTKCEYCPYRGICAR